MAETLRVGIIGVGGIAGTHFPGWIESPLAEVVALADVSKDALERVGEERGVERLFTDPYELIKRKDLDIVDVCTPNMYHYPLTVAALEAGKHVICEKPLAPTTDEIRKMIQARDKSGKLLMTAQHFRFEGKARALKAEIDAGALGEVYHARCWWLRRSGAPTRAGFIEKRHSGGGPCIDLGVHLLDLALWMMGSPKPVSVCGVTQDVIAHGKGAFSASEGPIPKTWDVEEFAGGFVRFENGATLFVEVSWLLHHKTEGDDLQVWLYGDKGGAHWPSNELVSSNPKTRQLVNTRLTLADRAAPHARECMAFAEAIAKGKPSPVPPEQSLDVIGILEALYRSAETGREVRL